jgi:1-aminocyclopropane-1-carboxylate deaminase
MQKPDLKKISVDPVGYSLFHEKNIRVEMLRLDKIHPVISGNKFFKLKYHLQSAVENNCKGMLTFGGAWSNHIVATAYSAALNNLHSIGIIRGEKPERLSATLVAASGYGMQLEFESRAVYRTKNSHEFLHSLQEKFPGYYIIPEGGSGASGIKGASEIMDWVQKEDYSHIVCAVGTGTMYIGIVNNTLPGQIIIGIPVLKGLKNLTDQLIQFFNRKERKPDCIFFYDYHFGGYAKYREELIRFMNEFYTQTLIPSDIVYTGKLLYAITDLARKDYFPAGSRVLVIHSGGLQGNSSLKKGTLIFST